MTPQDSANANADAMAAELRRIIEQAEQLMAAAGVDNASLGPTAVKSEPNIEQVLVARHKDLADQDAFERKLFLGQARKLPRK